MATTRITVKSNGSLRIEGDFENRGIRMEMYMTFEEELQYRSAAAGFPRINRFAIPRTKGISSTMQLHLHCHRRMFEV
jgi:hypothetical protein